MTSTRIFLQTAGTIGFGITLFLIFSGLVRSCNPDVEIRRNEETLASCVCGTMYVASHKCDEDTFRTLVQRCNVICGDSGTEGNYRNPDGSLKHVIALGDRATIAEPGTKFDTCIINWEVTPEVAVKAFQDVCINRKF